MRRLLFFIVPLLCSASFVAAAEPLPLLSPLFADHAVLQRGRAVPVWGWTEAGKKVVVRFAGQTKEAVAGADGKWMCSLDPLEASFEGGSLTVETAQAELLAEAKDLLVGDVWLCSGQSNMEMGITLCHEEEEIAKADHPNLRLLTVPHRIAYAPEKTFVGSWKPCSPETVADAGWGGFSAAAYFFGKELQQKLGVPIGLIHSSWGGTMIEAWTAGPVLQSFPDTQAELKDVNAIASSTSANPLNEIMDAWFLKNDPGTAQHWEKAETDTSAWRKVTLPNNYAACGIPGYEGVVWVQREIDLPVQWHEQPLVIHLGTISDTNTAWFNGKEIGRADSYEHETCYTIPAGIAKGGQKNVITLRITNAGGGGIQANDTPMQIKMAGIDPHAEKSIALLLSGEWRLQETASKGKTGRPIVGNPRVPSVLYNGMIAPLAPCALTGVIWYQGEANAGAARLYSKLLPAMIGDWRKVFAREDLAFHIVQLANYQAAGDQPRDNDWADLREAQAMTAKTVPNCGLAVTIDIGDAKDIHPKNKREVGHRLALSALAKTYGKEVVSSGPWYREMKIEGDRIRVRFDHADGGLVLKEPSAKSFAIAGEDGKFVWATAVVDGESVVVSSPAVTKPVAVRYAWDGNPEAGLSNGAGMPAIPFRAAARPSSVMGQ